jgi:hypothetical protein
VKYMILTYAVFLKRLYVLFFLELASRRILFTACSEHPGGAWAAQQARNLSTSSTTTGTDLVAAWSCDRRVDRL